MLKSLSKEWDYFRMWSYQHTMARISCDLIGPCPAKAEYFSGEFYVIICIDTTTSLINWYQIKCCHCKKKYKTCWHDIPDQCMLSMIMEASFQDMPLPTFFASWESNMFPCQVKILNQMQYANVCKKLWQFCERSYPYFNRPKHHKMSFTLLMMDYNYNTWNEIYYLNNIKSKSGCPCILLIHAP